MSSRAEVFTLNATSGQSRSAGTTPRSAGPCISSSARTLLPASLGRPLCSPP